MSKKGNSSIRLFRNGNLSPEALQAFVQGSLSPDERRQVDEFLSKDPFAQEALEGLQAMPQVDLIGETKSLNQQISAKAGLKSGTASLAPWMRWMAAAAMLFLLVLLGYLVPRWMETQNTPIAAERSAPDALAEPAPGIPSDGNLPAGSKMDAVEIKKEEEMVPVQEENNRELSTNESGEGVVLPTTAVKDQTPLTADLAKADKKQAESKSALSDKYEEKPAVASSGAVPGMAQEENANKAVAVSASRYKSLESVQTDAVVVRESSQLSESDAEPSESGMEKAMDLYNQKKFAESARAFDQLIQSGGKNSEAIYYSGLSHYVNNNYGTAIARFNQLIAENKRYRNGSIYYKALILIKTGKSAEAKPLLEELKQSGGSYRKKATEALEGL